MAGKVEPAPAGWPGYTEHPDPLAHVEMHPGPCTFWQSDDTGRDDLTASAALGVALGWLPRARDAPDNLETWEKAAWDDTERETLEREAREELVVMAQFRCENFGVTDAMLRTLGEGEFPVVALLSHRCVPGCAVVYSMTPGRKVSLKVLHDHDTLCGTNCNVAHTMVPGRRASLTVRVLTTAANAKVLGEVQHSSEVRLPPSASPC